MITIAIFLPAFLENYLVLHFLSCQHKWSALPCCGFPYTYLLLLSCMLFCKSFRVLVFAVSSAPLRYPVLLACNGLALLRCALFLVPLCVLFFFPFMLSVSRFVFLHAGCFPVLFVGIVVVLSLTTVFRYVSIFFYMLLCCAPMFDLLLMFLSVSICRFLF